MGDLPAPICAVLQSSIWRVEHCAVRIMRLDDPAKVKRAIRAYREAADKLLAQALADRDARMAERPADG